MFKRSVLVATLLATATPALAHTGDHTVSGFLAGFSHPLTGLDHSLAMIGVGLFASFLGGRALWAVPASFVSMMIAGGIVGLVGTEMPAVEIAIAASVVALGAVVSFGLRWSLAAAMALVGGFAIFHGYAHGAEMPTGAAASLYCLGFTLASGMLHGLGIGLGLISLRHADALRIAGTGVAAAGVLLFFV